MKNRRNVSNKTVAIPLALVLAIGCAVGGTLAWLISKTDPVVNTFTYGDINIGLEETTGSNYTITPGMDITKDPKVTVKANSEACWLFVKVKEENWPTLADANGTKKVSYSIADGWTALKIKLTSTIARSLRMTKHRSSLSSRITRSLSETL